MAKSTTIRTVSRAMLAGNVEVVFQPIVDIRNGGLFAYEALARTSKFDGPIALFDGDKEGAEA